MIKIKIRKEAWICLKELTIPFVLISLYRFIFRKETLNLDFAISLVLTFIVILCLKLLIIGIIERIIYDTIKETIDELDEETEIKFENIKKGEIKQ